MRSAVPSWRRASSVTAGRERIENDRRRRKWLDRECVDTWHLARKGSDPGGGCHCATGGRPRTSEVEHGPGAGACNNHAAVAALCGHHVCPKVHVQGQAANPLHLATGHASRQDPQCVECARASRSAAWALLFAQSRCVHVCSGWSGYLEGCVVQLLQCRACVCIGLIDT